MENRRAALRSCQEHHRVKTPDYIDWIRIGIITAIILLVVIGGVAIYILTRPKPPPVFASARCASAPR